MRCIIDSDTLAFASASMAEGMGVDQAYFNVNKSLEGLLARLNTSNYTLYLTGENNFRYKIFPEYKRYRRDLPRPEHLQAVKEYLKSEYQAVISDGCEADDLCGIDQCQSEKAGEETMIVSIDKDLDMVPGWHFSPAIVRLGVEVRPERQYLVSPLEAIRFFYYQLLVGDSGDGIKGVPGIGKVKAAKILEGLDNEKDLYEAVESYYSCEEELLLNGQCLWIWREENGIWQIPDW